MTKNITQELLSISEIRNIRNSDGIHKLIEIKKQVQEKQEILNEFMNDIDFLILN